jgi:hypothetical protein
MTKTITGVLWLPLLRPEVLAAVGVLAAAATEQSLLFPASCVIFDECLPTADSEQGRMRDLDLA